MNQDNIMHIIESTPAQNHSKDLRESIQIYEMLHISTFHFCNGKSFVFATTPNLHGLEGNFGGKSKYVRSMLRMRDKCIFFLCSELNSPFCSSFQGAAKHHSHLFSEICG